MRDKHKSKVHCSFTRTNVLGCFSDTKLEVVHKRLFIIHFILAISSISKTIVVFERKLRVNWNHLHFHKHGRVYNLTILKCILHFKTFWRQHILKNSLKVVLTKNSTLFWILQNTLELFELVCDRKHLLTTLTYLSRLLHHITKLLVHLAIDFLNQLATLPKLQPTSLLHSLIGLSEFTIKSTRQVLELLLH